MHRRAGARVNVYRLWWAPGAGLVKGETLGQDGRLVKLDLVCARLSGRNLGDITREATFEAVAALDEGPLDRTPITLAEAIKLISPLNINLQAVAGYKLVEIDLIKGCRFIFAAAEGGIERSVFLFRNRSEAARVRGDRLASGKFHLVMEAPTKIEEVRPADRELLKKLAALVFHNQKAP